MTNQKQNKRYERLSTASKKQLQIESESVLNELQNGPDRSSPGMEYFYELGRRYSRGDIAKQDKKKYIGTSCVQVPIELIYAAGAIPVRTCSGSHAMSQAGAEFLPAKSCSLVSASYGTIYTDSIPVPAKPLAIVIPTTCDQKKKLSEIPSGMDIPYYTLELPPTKDSEEAQMYWYRSVKKFCRDLEGITGKRITRNRLKSAILKVARAQQTFRKLHQIRKKHPSFSGTNAILIANTFFYDDIDSWTEHLNRLNQELAPYAIDNPEDLNKNAPRILLTGSPSIFPNFKLPVMRMRREGRIFILKRSPWRLPEAGTDWRTCISSSPREIKFATKLPGFLNLLPMPQSHFFPTMDGKRTSLAMRKARQW